jgi:D-alanyl-lipoteichoic acid acyltransferase DltB (MBOAT superfamily)
MVIADNCATVVNEHWAEYQSLPTVTLLLLGFLFTMQIYCDFSGYSDIAIGCARLFGFDLKRNFNFPYFSRSIPEFWRRWHISLTTWFRDYIYFPLGGSRCSKWKIIRNVFIVWAVSGLWHGANWTFVCWGLFHAVLLAIYNLLSINTKYKDTVTLNVKSIFQMGLTFFLAMIGWIIFRAESLSQVGGYFEAMVSNQFIDFSMLYGKKAVVFAAVMLFVEWLQREKEHALQFPEIKVFKPAVVRWGVYFLLTIIILGVHGSSQTFIYFQF